MNYLLRISLLHWLAISTPSVIAAGRVKSRGVISGGPSATIQAFPSVHSSVNAPSQESTQSVLVEGFWPFLMQQQEQLLFLQGAWQRQQQQNLLSIGLGWRYFPETQWGVGYHLFYDQETTRQQHRLGLGAEAWLHSLTLAVNGYLPANDWRKMHDLKNYQQRPASGYIVILRGYLPTLPHLGASLHYARYSGDEVALGRGQQRYRNPQQWRWGVDITPIPLLTLVYHRQAGLSAQAKQQISATLTYRFSLPLSQQLDPQQVPVLHSAGGQRWARVQREQLMALHCAVLSNDKAFGPEEAARVAQGASHPEKPSRTQAGANNTEAFTRTHPVAIHIEELPRIQAVPITEQIPSDEKKVISAEIRYLALEWAKKSVKDDERHKFLLLRQSIDIIRSYRRSKSLPDGAANL